MRSRRHLLAAAALASVLSLRAAPQTQAQEPADLGSADEALSGLARQAAQSRRGAQKPAAAPAERTPGSPIKHVVVIMQENHSFDNYFGRLNQPEYYGKEVDGLDLNASNPDASGRPVRVYHMTSLTPADPDHETKAMLGAWNQGRNDGFAKNMGPISMGYFDQRDIPYYYALANEYAIADRYFSTMLGPTMPNRFFLYAASSGGHATNEEDLSSVKDRKTIFDLLDAKGVSWKYYLQSGAAPGKMGYIESFSVAERDRAHLGTFEDYAKDAAAGALAEVTFLDSDATDQGDEHPPANIQVGQAWVAARVETLKNSPCWKDSALFLTYDEGGGFYDHVPPPESVPPDGANPGSFTHYGFRVPLVVVSPLAKKHYVSHRVYDHTSILKFIETRFRLPPLSARDAAANDLTDFFDFGN